jgi:hypothetical protein
MVKSSGEAFLATGAIIPYNQIFHHLGEMVCQEWPIVTLFDQLPAVQAHCLPVLWMCCQMKYCRCQGFRCPAHEYAALILRLLRMTPSIARITGRPAAI